MTKNLIINEELKNLLPPLSAEEFAGLEADILKHGCLSPLIVWNDILVDGHHRYEICRKHEIPFAVNTIVLDSLDEAKFWTWQHQKHRRNLTAYHRAELALKLKDVIMAKAKERQRAAGGDRKSENAKSVPQNSAEPKETRQELAEISSVSHDTVSRAEYIAEHADEETKQKLRSGEKGISINKEYNRLRAERNAAKTNVDTEMNSKFDEDYASQFRPGSLPTKKYVGKTQLKPIPRDRPDILIANLIAFFPQAREIFRMLHNRYGKEVTKPLAMEFYNEYARRK